MHAVDSNPFQACQARIAGAQTWRELEDICSALDQAFLTGGITDDALELLCVRVAQKACAIPAHRIAPTAEPLGKSGQCDCCGSTALRDTGGQIVCSVCHPDPRRAVSRRRAA